MVAKLLLLLAGLILLLAAYIRLAPSDPVRWHVDVEPTARGFRAGLVEVIPAEVTTLGQLADIALATPRTSLLAGSVADGHMTLVTRSALWGFPDYTTMQLTGDGRLAILSRLRFGGSDGGVNAARVADWLQRLQAVQ